MGGSQPVCLWGFQKDWKSYNSRLIVFALMRLRWQFIVVSKYRGAWIFCHTVVCYLNKYIEFVLQVYELIVAVRKNWEVGGWGLQNPYLVMIVKTVQLIGPPLKSTLNTTLTETNIFLKGIVKACPPNSGIRPKFWNFRGILFKFLGKRKYHFPENIYSFLSKLLYIKTHFGSSAQ